MTLDELYERFERARAEHAEWVYQYTMDPPIPYLHETTRIQKKRAKKLRDWLLEYTPEEVITSVIHKCDNWEKVKTAASLYLIAKQQGIGAAVHAKLAGTV